jgi:uncharacterized membrane protein YkoI
LAAAVTAAEKRLEGQAIGVDHAQQEDGRSVYEIEVRYGSNVFDVEVDADKGTVIAPAEGRPSADDDKPD